MKTDTDSWITLTWYSVSPFTFQYFCYQKIQAQNFSVFGWMLKLSLVLDSPPLSSCMAIHVCSEPSWGRDVGRLAGSAGVGAGVVAEKGLVWVA